MAFVSYRLSNVNNYRANRVALIKEYRGLTGKSLKEAVEVFPTNGHFEDGQIITVDHDLERVDGQRFFKVIDQAEQEPSNKTVSIEDKVKELTHYCVDQGHYNIVIDLIQILKHYF